MIRTVHKGIKKCGIVCTICISVLIGFFAFGCSLFEWSLWPDINIQEYEELPPSIPAWETLISSRDDAYSEIRIQEEFVTESAYNRTITFGSFDAHCRSKDCQEDYEKAFQATDNIITYIYYLPGPACEVRHVSIKDENVVSSRTLDAFLALFRPYERIDKVAPLLSIKGFYWGQGKEKGLIKPIDGGFEAIVLSGMHCGEGLFYNQVQVDYSGTLKTIRTKRAQWGKDCIY